MAVSDPGPVLDDLRAESEELDGLVSGLGDEGWRTATPAAGWTVAHQIAHLVWTDRSALLAATDPDAFTAGAVEAMTDPEGTIGRGADEGARLPPHELLARWRAGREELQDALRSVAASTPGARLPWYGPSMSVAGVATGRIMETWAHGQDVADTLGVTTAPTRRLRHIVRIGVRARDYAYFARGLQPPAEEFRVEITGPDGEVWAHGPQDAPQRVTGDAFGFCRLVTQRAHRDDVAVRAEGPDAVRWLGIAQAFAGPPGAGRAPGAHGAGGADGTGSSARPGDAVRGGGGGDR